MGLWGFGAQNVADIFHTVAAEKDWNKSSDGAVGTRVDKPTSLMLAGNDASSSFTPHVV